MPSFFPPARLRKEGILFTRYMYLLFLIKQTEKYSSAVIIPPTVPPRRYLLTLEALPSHSSRGIEQGQGRGGLYIHVRMQFDDGKIVAGIYIDKVHT